MTTRTTWPSHGRAAQLPDGADGAPHRGSSERWTEERHPPVVPSRDEFRCFD